MPFNMVNKGNKTAEVRIYGAIGSYKMFEEDTTPSDFQNKLDDLGDIEYLNVDINSPGGGIYAGITIYNILKNHPAVVKTRVMGIAASIASLVLQAGDERQIAKNGTVYLHNPMGGAWGYSKDLRKMAEELDKIKEPILNSFDNTKVSPKRLMTLMDEETTLTASEALKIGLVDSIGTENVKSYVKNSIVTFDDVSFDSEMFSNFDASKIVLFNGNAGNPNASDLAEMEKRCQIVFGMQSAINSIEINNLTPKGA